MLTKSMETNSRSSEFSAAGRMDNEYRGGKRTGGMTGRPITVVIRRYIAIAN